MAHSEADDLCMEDLLKTLGMLSSESEYASNIKLCSKLLKGIDVEATVPVKKVSLSQCDCHLELLLVHVNCHCVILIVHIFKGCA